MSAAAKREQRLEIESNLKKDYKSAPKTRASAKREVKPAFDAKPKRDFGDDAKPAPRIDAAPGATVEAEKQADKTN